MTKKELTLTQSLRHVINVQIALHIAPLLKTVETRSASIAKNDDNKNKTDSVVLLYCLCFQRGPFKVMR